MKKLLLMCLMGICAMTPSYGAVVRTYPDALARTGKRPIVIFIYGANYDRQGQKTYEEFIKKNKIAPYIRQATFLEMPLYQMPNEREKKDMEKRLGNKRLPGGIRSYPCLAVVDAEENLRAVVQSPEEMKDAETALAALKVHLDNFEAQEKILNRARRTKGDKRAELLLEASDYDLNMPRSMMNAQGSDDKELKNRLSFDPNSLVEALQTMTYDEANAHVRKMMAQGGYSKLQRQMIMAAYAGHLRRGGEGQPPASKERLRALYTEMRNIDPDSTYGAYAEGALVIWVEGGQLTDEPMPSEDYMVRPAPNANKGSGGGGKGKKGTGTAMGSTEMPDEPVEEPDDFDDEESDDDF